MNNISIETLLYYSPYDVKVPTPYGILTKEVAEDFFFENIFVEYPEAIRKIMINLQHAIEDEWIIGVNFVGSGSCGKTTFLKRFFRENNKYACSYLNLFERPSSLESEQCFRNSVTELLAYSFDKNTAGLLYQTYCNWKSNSLKGTHWHFFGEGNKLLEFIALCNLIARDESRLNLIIELERIGFNTIELMTLHFLAYTVNHLNEDRPLVFVFDNLEELNNKYLQTVLQTIFQAFSNAQYYCEKVLRFSFERKVTIIVSSRQMTSEYLGINQLSDRVVSHWTRIVFPKDCQVDFCDILNTRINFYDKQGNNTENAEKLSLLISSEKTYIKQCIEPLLSFDYRKLAYFISKLFLEKDGFDISDFLVQTNKCDDAEHGARGVLLFYILHGMISDKNSRLCSYVIEELTNEDCSIYHVVFSLLTNMCGWFSKPMVREKYDNDESLGTVGIISFMHTIRMWYPEYEEKILKLLVENDSRSLESPFTLLTGPNDGNAILSIADMMPQLIQDYFDNQNNLANVSIRVNLLCQLYISHVFVQYEYFNLVSYYRINVVQQSPNNGFSPKPLFQFDDAERDAHAIKSCLLSTFETAKTIIEKEDYCLCKKCKMNNNGTCMQDCASFLEKYINDGFSINKTIFATRVIFSHIRYLEHYRRFLWHKTGDAYHSQANISIQKVIVQQILEYIDYYSGRKIKDSNYYRISNVLKKQYVDASILIEKEPQLYTTINLDKV